MILLVTYDISPKKRDYTSFYEALKAYPATTWWHYLENTWLIKTEETASSLRDRLQPLIDAEDDSLLVTRVNLSEYSGWLPRRAWEWIKENS